ncbi:MAG: hypothetical protein DCC49_05865 [Acidobacteria bacterium]|nr:MAG: hypothetical protein DCC49_05865 [Acidobacteriota bacterium]
MIKQHLAKLLTLALALAMIITAGCAQKSADSPASPGKKLKFPQGVESFAIDDDTGGYLQQFGPLSNLVVISHDPDNFKAEYEAGYIQGRLQKGQLTATRDNLWDTIARVDPGYPKNVPPTTTETATAKKMLIDNWNYTIEWVQRASDSKTKERLSRLIYRLVGIYDGATKAAPTAGELATARLPKTERFSPEELTLNYESPTVSFLDVYFINAVADLMDAMDNKFSRSKCSAYIKRTSNEIYLAHNSWFSFLDQSMASTYQINDTFVTVNALSPGNILSNTDFGYNANGIMFNETTELATHSEPKVEALWMLWRGALAEQFAATLDEFFELTSLEGSGTYMNGYGLIDMKTQEIGLVEMTWKDFILFKSNKTGGYDTRTKPEGLPTGYDHELIQPDVILGVNFPASLYVREQIQSIENRPMRRQQFLARMDTVTDVASAQALITYTAPGEPLSIYGRWDLGFGTTPKPKTIPEGSVDAKVVTASRAKASIPKAPGLTSSQTQPFFWMKYGTPVFEPPPAGGGKPFIWSESQWSNQKLRQVPDVVTGEWAPIAPELN